MSLCLTGVIAPRLQAHPPAQAATGPVPGGLWNRQRVGSDWRVGIEFTNYNGDRLSALFPLTSTDVDDATSEFGYTRAEAQAIVTTCKGCDQAEVDRRVVDFYHRRGFKTVATPGFINLTIDMPEVVFRNAPRVRAVAAELERQAHARNYDSTAMLGAVLAMAQTGLPYFSPPVEENGRAIMGLYVPPQVLAVGKGDCDSKTALVASVLKNFSNAHVIGINLPNHYLMGVARVPQRGDMFVEYGGEQYVLLEPAGPGWLPPGQVSDYSKSLLGTMRDVRIDPFR